MTERRVVIHVQRACGCGCVGCELDGFHFHWRGRAYRSAFDGSMSPAELADFDADCRADHAERVSAERARLARR